jgi:hypothetical protein
MFVQAPPAPTSINCILYGPGGSGKSTAAATAPGPILWANCQGANALAYPRTVAAKRGTAIHEVEFNRETPDPVGQFRALLSHIASGNEPVCRTLVVDTLGDLRDLFARKIVKGPQSRTREQWGEVAEIIKSAVLWLRDRDINVVFLAHEDISDVDDDRVVRPKIGGALTEQVISEVDVVAYCGAHRTEDGVKYMGQLVELKGRRAKDRSNGLGQARNLDLDEWLDAFRAALTPNESDIPFAADFEAPPEDPSDPGHQIGLEPAAEPVQAELGATA